MRKAIPFIALAVILVGSYYFIFSQKEFGKKDDSSVEIPLSKDLKYLENLNEKEIQDVLLQTLPDNALEAKFGGKVFCSDYLYGFDTDKEQKTVSVYLYAYCEEYYFKGDDILLGGGISSPLKVVYSVSDSNLVFESLYKPEEGSNYQKSISDIFPEVFVSDILKGIDVNTLVPSPKIQADNYFKGRLEVYF